MRSYMTRTLERKQAAFYAYASGTTSVNVNTPTPVALAAELFDYSSVFDSSRFTASVKGLYQFEYAIRINSAANSTEAYLRLNGATKISTTSSPLTSTGNSGSAILSLTAGDYVELIAYHNAGSARTVQAAQASTFLAGSLIAAGG